MQPAASDNFAERFFTPLRFGILLALLVFAAFPQVLLGLQTFVVRDYGFFVYPLAHFQQQCFFRGELPFWNPYNNCGVPFLAQWNTMPLYPPSLIYLLPPLEWSLSFFCLLHLWFAGLGMFFLARRWTGNSFAAAFAGVAFAFSGLTLNLLMWPSHLATFSWAPWVVLAVERAWREGRQKIILAAFAGALQMLAGGPEIIFLTWLLLLALWLQQLVVGGGDASSPALFATGASSPRGAMLWRFPLVVALVIALAAAQLLPFLDLVAHAQRETGYTDLRWSMPGWGWVNFLVPMAFGTTHTEGIFFQQGQYWTSSYYPGIGTLWLALLALGAGRDSVESKSKVRLLGAAAVVALIFALGENTPLYPALRKIIPQLSYVTYPVKYVSLVALLAPLLAAFALARLQNSYRATRWGETTGEPRQKSNEPPARGDARPTQNKPHEPLGNFQKRLLFIGAILLALIAAILFWAGRFPFPTDDVHATLTNGLSRAAFLILTGALLLVLTRETGPGLRRIAPLLLIIVAWLDVFTHEPVQNPTVPPSIYELNLARTKLAMDPQPELGGSRAMTTPAAAMDFIHFALNDPKNNFLAKRLGYCANCNLLDAVPKVDGFFSLTPRESDGVISLLYGTTNASFPRLNDFLGVSQITAPDEMFHWQPRRTFLPLVTAGQKPVFLDDTNALRALAQNNFDGGKMVLLPPEARSLVTVTNPTTARVLASKFGTQTVTAEIAADAPSLVVVAQTYYHNWRVYVDGRPVPLLRANYSFQAFQVPAGRHQARLAYEDKAFQIGAAIAIPVWVNCVISFGLMRKRPAPPESEPLDSDSLI